MAGLFQGDPLPAVRETKEAAQTAPEFYNNYLQDIANLGQNAITQGGIAGFSPLQQVAIGMAPNLAFSGSGSLGAASQLLGEAGATTSPDVVSDYMNPYVSGVVNEMARLQQRNIQENVLPNLAGAAVGSGQFGSRRQQQITGNALRDLQADLLGKQTQALREGYTEASKFAQNDLQRAMQSGQLLTQLGEEQQKLGLGGLKSLYDYGGYEQALGQKALDYPMAQAQAFAKLLGGYQVPFSRVEQNFGPKAGAYSNSPLSQIAGLLSALAAFNNPPKTPTKKEGGLAHHANGGATKAPPMSATMAGKGRRMRLGGYAGTETPIAYTDGTGNVYDVDGYLVSP